MNLAKFVTLYKTLLLLQKKINGGKVRSHDTFFAGLLGGYVVFGDRTAINEQVRDYPDLRRAVSYMFGTLRSCYTSARALSHLSFRVVPLHVLHRHPARPHALCRRIRVTLARLRRFHGVW